MRLFDDMAAKLTEKMGKTTYQNPMNYMKYHNEKNRS